MAGIDRWLHYTVTTIDRFHCTYMYYQDSDAAECTLVLRDTDINLSFVPTYT